MMWERDVYSRGDCDKVVDIDTDGAQRQGVWVQSGENLLAHGKQHPCLKFKMNI